MPTTKAILPPTPEDDAAILTAAKADPDAQPLTDAQLAAMVPMRSPTGESVGNRGGNAGNATPRTERNAQPGEAVAEYVARQDPDALTDQINAVCEEVDTHPDPFVTAAARRILERTE